MRRGVIILTLLLIFLGTAVAVKREVLVTRMPGRSFDGPLPPISPAQTALAQRLRADVQALAGEIGERNLFRQGTLDRAAQYIEQGFEAAGHHVASQEFTVRTKTVRNVEAVIPGRHSDVGIIVVGAHYDSIQGSPGANDNASGVAALLELSRALSGKTLQRTVRLVAFVNEEPPFFYTDSMGSVRYARRLVDDGDNVAVMMSLETIGYYTDEPGTQRYPFPLSFFYPDTGNYIGFVGNSLSKTLVRRMVRTFRKSVAFPSEGLAAPAWIRGVDWSDHWAFWREGLPAVMVTDTALYRYREYHSADDVPGIIDYERMARVVDGLIAVITDLANGTL